jgi:uncharacterized protein YeaO (DUF488 family)
MMHDDGFRVLVMQYWPRGLKREKVDAWYRDLGSSKELIKPWKTGKITWPQFKKQYVADLKEEHKQVLIHELAKRAKEEKITLLCSCRDSNMCHRSVLKELIERAQ